MSADSARRNAPKTAAQEKTGAQEPGFDRARMSAKADTIAQQLSALKGMKSRAGAESGAETPRGIYEASPTSTTQPAAVSASSPASPSESAAPPPLPRQTEAREQELPARNTPSARGAPDEPARWELSIPPDLQRASRGLEAAPARRGDSRHLALLAGGIAAVMVGAAWAYLQMNGASPPQESATIIPAPSIDDSATVSAPAAQSPSLQPAPQPDVAQKQKTAPPPPSIVAGQSAREAAQAKLAEPDAKLPVAPPPATPAQGAAGPVQAGLPPAPDPMEALLRELQAAAATDKSPAGAPAKPVSSLQPLRKPAVPAPPPTLQPPALQSDHVLKLPPNATSTAPAPGARPFVPDPLVPRPFVPKSQSGAKILPTPSSAPAQLQAPQATSIP